MAARNNLPLTATHWGTYRVEAEDGRVRALHGFEQDSDISPIGPGIVDVLKGPSRIETPMVRESWLKHGPGSNTGARGGEAFVPVSWETANRLVADELRRVIDTHGNAAIFGGSYGWASAGRFHHAQSQLHRFLNCIGGYTGSVNTYSFAAAEVVVPHILGSFRHYLQTATPWESIIEHTELFVAFGGVPLKNGQINSGGVGNHAQRASVSAARAAGVEFVVLSPLRDDIIAEADAKWLTPRPCTDTALMLGLAHTLLHEGLHASDFLSRYAIGFEQFASYLLGEHDGVAKTAAWAAAICDIEEDKIIELARRMASQRTMISVSWSLTRQDHGEQAYWAAITLAAMLGQIGLPGGGIGFGYSAINSIGMNVAPVPITSLPQGANPIKSFIPVARISDMLLHPGESFEFNGGEYDYPDIRLIYWAGGNPFHHHQDLNRMVEAWRKPETVIVHEWCWNAHAKHADIVLPCTTPLERNDIAMTPRDPYWVFMEKATATFGEARNDYDIFRGIAALMNSETSFTKERDELQWLQWLYEKARARAEELGNQLPSFDEFCDRRWFKLEAPSEAIDMLRDFRRDPIQHALKTPSGKIEIFSQTIAEFDYDDCSGHASWYEPVEWLGNASAAFPLHLISNQPKTKLHSQLDHGSHSRSSKIQGREPVTVNSDDAAKRSISDGDIVRLYNNRGACLAGAVISDNIMPGVVQLSTGAWFDPIKSDAGGRLCKHGNPNVLTKDQGTSRLGQGPIAHSCLVQIEKFVGTPPSVTAFDPPKILSKARVD